MIESVVVPCGSCRQCCRNTLVALFPEHGDDVASYRCAPSPGLKDGRLALASKPNGDCVYLDDHGCSIHDRAPLLCRLFDCRRFFARHSRAERRQLVKSGMVDAQLFEQGRRRLDTLTAAELAAARSAPPPLTMVTATSGTRA